MSLAQPSVAQTPLYGVSPPRSIAIVVAPPAAEAGFDGRWAAWQARGRARHAQSRGRLQTAGLIAIIAAALAGAVRLSFGGAL